MNKRAFIRKIGCFGILLTLLIRFQPAFAQTEFQTAYAEGIEARGEGNVEVFLQKIQQADSLRPNHRVILLRLAEAFTANGLLQKALETLSYRADFYANPDFKEEPFWDKLEAHPDHHLLLEKLKAKNKPEESSTLGFEVYSEGFHAEGLAYDGSADRFYISDVRCGEIFSIRPDGEDTRREFDLKEWGYWGAMGLALDREQGQLWVSSSVLPNFCEYDDSLDGRSAVLQIDLNSGNLMASYQTEGKHLFGDIILDRDGNIWVTDSRDPGLYKLNREKGALELFVEDSRFWNLQGLTRMGDHIYISDYITGLYAVELENRLVKEVSDENQRLRGTDGLYGRDGILYLMQNGTQPLRVSSIVVDENGREKPNSYKILEQASGKLGEPTLASWKEGQLYFIANSPWGYYDEDNIPLISDWPALQVRVIKP